MQPCEASPGSNSLHRCIEAINQRIKKQTKQYFNQLINKPTFISSFLPIKVYISSANQVIHHIIKPAPFFVASRLPACGSPAGASEARRSVHSKKPLCKPILSAVMRSTSRKLLIASLRIEKCKNRFKREKNAP
jgi:hypothetical protein